MSDLDTTNFEDYLKRIIFDLLYYRRGTNKETAWFHNKMHNTDLVPAIVKKVDSIIDLFEKYHKVTYDTQGIRDHGIDVLLRYKVGEENEGTTKYIGFQIKSHDDLNQKGWLTKLKAQILEAHYSVDLEDIYIIFCADLAEHYQQLRDAMADLAKLKDFHIVRPEFAYTFLQISTQTIAAYLKAKLSTDDEVYKQALGCLQEFTIHQSAIAIELAVCYYLEGKLEFTLQEIRNSQFVSATYRDYPCLPIDYYFDDDDETPVNGDVDQEEISIKDGDEKDLINDDLETLDLTIISFDAHNSMISIIPDNVSPLGALILDGYVRYGYSGHVLCEYLLSALVDDKIRKALEYKSQMDYKT